MKHRIQRYGVNKARCSLCKAETYPGKQLPKECNASPIMHGLSVGNKSLTDKQKTERSLKAIEGRRSVARQRYEMQYNSMYTNENIAEKKAEDNRLKNLLDVAAFYLDGDARSLAIHLKMLSLPNGGTLLDIERRVNQYIEPCGWKLIRILPIRESL